MRMILKKDKGYALRHIQGVPYLIPIGQMNANFRGDVRLNSTGELIWGLLDEGLTGEEVAQKCVEVYECDESKEGLEQAARIREVTGQFVDSLLNKGIVYPVEEGMQDKPSSFGSGKSVWERIDAAYPEFESSSEVKARKKYSIAGLELYILSDTENLPDELGDFELEEAAEAGSGFDAKECASRSDSSQGKVQSLYIKKRRPFSVEQSGTILDSNDLWLSLLPGGYLLKPNLMKSVDIAVMNGDGSRVEIFYSEDEGEAFKSELFEVMGFCFHFFAQRFGLISLHSSSILYKDKAWMFSGPSGRGKSTHTAIWKRLFDVELINGDINCFSIENNIISVKGLPWCGTSGVSSTKDFEAAGISFIEWADSDSIREMSYTEKVLYALHRLITPMWDEAQLDINLDFAKKLAERMDMCILRCTMQDSAALTMKDRIDAGSK